MKSSTMIKGSLALLFIMTGLFLLSEIPNEPMMLEASKEEDTMTLTDRNTLDEELHLILQDKALQGALVGLTVKHAETGEEIFSHQGDTRLHPASNMKLLTASAALETLGPDYRFQTEILTDGKLVGNTLQGNLYVKGKGDPTLLKSDFNQLAQELKALGIHEIEGNLIGDDTWYDDIRLSQDLNWSDEPFHTGAQISALSLSPNEDYDTGTVIVDVLPSNDNTEKPIVRVNPETDYVEIINEAQHVAAGEPQDITVEREHGKNRILITGDMPADGTLSRSWVSVWEPTGYAMAVFQDALDQENIQVTEETAPLLKPTPLEAEVLVSKKSMPLSELLIPFMKLSNNGMGEVLTKEMGKVVHDKGTWDEGLAVIEDVAARLGMNREEFLLRDGSGMSHKTLVSSNHLAQLLYEAQDKNWFEAFKKSLPVAGAEERFTGGTLRHRLTTDPVKGNAIAKTGLITGVSTLSGYVTNQGGDELIFSILINNHLGSSEAMQEIEDEMVRTLASYEF
jgi:D-alanyl-D-alanine carboxypeptidase/D-alanyl-D-alanine-endopeptidase (penicillin-binding protein 4)